MYNIFNTNMDPSLIIMCLFLFSIGIGVIIYYGEECCKNTEHEEENRSDSNSESTVRVTSPIH